MKKICSALLVITLICLLCASLDVVAFAASDVGSNGDVYFVEPVSVAVVDDYLFVADKVDDGAKSILHCFKCSKGEDGKITFSSVFARDDLATDGAVITKLSASEHAFAQSTDGYVGSLYVIIGNVATLYNVKTDGTLAAAADDSAYAYTTINKEGLVDVCIGQYTDYLAPYCVTSTNLFVYDTTVTNPDYKPMFTESKNNVTSCFADSTYVYFTENGVCRRYEGRDRGYIDDTFNQNNVKMTSGTATGVYTYGETDVAIYDAHNLRGIVDNTSASKDLLTLTEISIIDVAPSKFGGVFILDSENQVYLYALGETAYTKTDFYVGSDTVSLTPPTAYTSFTLAQSVGYPTNIVYKTTDDEHSVDGVKKNFNGTDFIVLGYDGDEDCAYYYVLIGESFGWIRKTNASDTPSTDTKINVVPTEVSTDLKYQSKFNSLNTAYVYELPFENASKTAVKQSATAMITVTLLNKFDRDGMQWYYVSYPQDEATCYGFVKTNALGQFSIEANAPTELILLKGERKINASLFEAVRLYATADLTDGTEIYSNGKPIKLYSGDMVRLVQTQDDAAEILILRDDGSTDYGWVAANYLIESDAITSNAVVGIVLLCAAVVLAAVLIVVFKLRKSKKQHDLD